MATNYYARKLDFLVNLMSVLDEMDLLLCLNLKII